MSDELTEALSLLSKDLSPRLIKSLREARDARDAVHHGSEDDAIEDLHAQLVRNRAMIERLEFLTSTLGLMKSRTRAAVSERRAAYDDAYMHAATKRSVGFSDYASAKEKDAHFALGTVAETMALRKAERAHYDVEAAWDYCRILMRGAEGVQRDLETRIRLIHLRSNLER